MRQSLSKAACATGASNPPEDIQDPEHDQQGRPEAEEKGFPEGRWRVLGLGVDGHAVLLEQRFQAVIGERRPLGLEPVDVLGLGLAARRIGRLLAERALDRVTGRGDLGERG